jgi:hypothetical protein
VPASVLRRLASCERGRTGGGVGWSPVTALTYEQMFDELFSGHGTERPVLARVVEARSLLLHVGAAVGGATISVVRLRDGRGAPVLVAGA